jgi:hypothetical protein
MDLRDSAPITEQRILQQLSANFGVIMLAFPQTNERTSNLFLATDSRALPSRLSCLKTTEIFAKYIADMIYL